MRPDGANQRNPNSTSTANTEIQPVWPWSVLVSIIHSMGIDSARPTPPITAVAAHMAVAPLATLKAAANKSARRNTGS
ncbi:hypothetical protein D3C86_1993790 [compost metagenome]